MARPNAGRHDSASRYAAGLYRSHFAVLQMSPAGIACASGAKVMAASAPNAATVAFLGILHLNVLCTGGIDSGGPQKRHLTRPAVLCIRC